MYKELKINLQDTEWKYDYIDHDRNIARAIVYDESGQFYFVRANRDDDFGKATLIETAGGGVEEGESFKMCLLYSTCNFPDCCYKKGIKRRIGCRGRGGLQNRSCK